MSLCFVSRLLLLAGCVLDTWIAVCGLWKYYFGLVLLKFCVLVIGVLSSLVGCYLFLSAVPLHWEKVRIERVFVSFECTYKVSECESL